MSNSFDNNLFKDLSEQERVCLFLNRLQSSPPPVLIIEGGCLEKRELVSAYWCASLNCPHSPPPCGQCQSCQRIVGHVYRDFYFMTTRGESLSVGEVRDIRRIMREKPSANGLRTFVISEAQGLTNAASNALLKSLEEPLPKNFFVLLTPLRSWLLNTVVSRSYVFTLPWQPQVGGDLSELVQDWTEYLISFWRTGRGLFEHTSQKGDVDEYLVREIVRACQQSLIKGHQGNHQSSLFNLFNLRESPKTEVSIIHILHKALEALKTQANPSLILDWLALQIFSLLHSDSVNSS